MLNSLSTMLITQEIKSLTNIIYNDILYYIYIFIYIIYINLVE